MALPASGEPLTDQMPRPADDSTWPGTLGRGASERERERERETERERERERQREKEKERERNTQTKHTGKARAY